MKKLSLQEVLEGIEDTRRERSVWYPLYEVLFIMVTAVICGATSYAKVEMFGKSKEEWLKKYIKLENGVPDACTFRNVIKAIDTQQLHEVFAAWMKGVVETVTGVVAIDGKQARGTKDAKSLPYMWSAPFPQSVSWCWDNWRVRKRAMKSLLYLMLCR